MKTIEFTRINNDVNGNPRYVCHFLNLLTEEENKRLDISERYAYAIKKAKKIGGKKYHTKNFGGGIAFQSYNISKTENDIKSLL